MISDEDFSQMFAGALNLGFSQIVLHRRREYYREMKSHLDKTAEWKRRQANKEISSAPNDSLLRAKWEGELQYWEYNFPHELLAQTIVSGMSYFENCVCQLAKDANLLNLAKYSPNRKGSILSIASETICNASGVAVDPKLGNRLNLYYRLRNILVHGNMQLSSIRDKQTLQADLLKLGAVQEKDGALEFESDVCEKMFDSIAEYIATLSSQVDSSWPQ